MGVDLAGIITVSKGCDRAIDWSDRKAWMLIKSMKYGLVWKSCCQDPECAICNNMELNNIIIGTIGMVKGLWGKKLKKNGM